MQKKLRAELFSIMLLLANTLEEKGNKRLPEGMFSLHQSHHLADWVEKNIHCLVSSM